MPSYQPPPDWELTKGLLLPPGENDRRRERQLAERKAVKGMLFSNWPATAGTRSGGAISREGSRVSHELLQYVARTCTLDQAIISRYISALTNFAVPAFVESKQLGFRVVHTRYNDPNFRPTEDEQRDIDARCREMTHRILTTTKPACNSFEEFMSWTMEDALVIDRMVMVKVPNRDGKPVSYHMLPGAEILPRIWYMRDYMANFAKRDPTFWDEQKSAMLLSEQFMANGTRDLNGNVIDLTNAAYVQVLPDGSIGGAWKEKDISVRISRRYADINKSLFGFSPVEQSLDVSYLWNSAWNYQKQLFQTTWPEALLIMHGDYSPEGMKAFQDDILAQHGNSQRLPVIAGGPKGETDVSLVSLRNTPTDMLFDQLLKFMLNLKCAYFSLHPSLINFASEGGSDSGLPQDRNFVVQMANEDGPRKSLRTYFHWITQEIVWPWYDDLVAIPEGLDMVPYDQLVTRELSLSAGGVSTFNETRAQLGKGPMPDIMPGINLGNMTGSQVQVAWMGSIQAQQAMQAQQGAQMNPPGMSAPEGNADGGDYGNGGAQLPQAPDGASGAPPAGTPPQPNPQAGGQPPPAQPPPPPAQKSWDDGYLRDDDGAIPFSKSEGDYLWDDEEVADD